MDVLVYFLQQFMKVVKKKSQFWQHFWPYSREKCSTLLTTCMRQGLWGSSMRSDLIDYDRNVGLLFHLAKNVSLVPDLIYHYKINSTSQMESKTVILNTYSVSVRKLLPTAFNVYIHKSAVSILSLFLWYLILPSQRKFHTFKPCWDTVHT